jgi:hypothetical protein
MDDLDRILSADDSIVPSSGFAARVMAAVHTEAAAPPPIPLPWRRLAVGPVLIGVAGVVWLVKGSGSSTPVSGAPFRWEHWIEWLAPLQPFVQPLALPLAAVLLSLALAYVSLSYAGARR